MLKKKMLVTLCIIGLVTNFLPVNIYAKTNPYIQNKITDIEILKLTGQLYNFGYITVGPVVYNLSDCIYTCGDKIFYRNIPTEQTYVIKDGKLSQATQAEERQMSIDVWNIAGVETRRKQLLSKDMADGFYFGVSGCNFWLNQPVPSGNTDESKEGCNDTEKYTNTEKQKKKNGEENEPSVPTPPPTPQPEPEVPIVDPVIE